MSFPLTIDLSATAVTLKPGAPASVVVTVRNVSPIVQHYEALVVGLPSEDLWSRDVETVKLRPGEAGAITVTISLPDGTRLLGGSYVLGVLVRSPYQPQEVSRAEELTMVVEAVAGVTLTAFPEIVHGKDEGLISVSVANTGNTPVTLDLVALDDQGKADFVINPPGVALAAGSTQPVQVTIRSRGPFSGPERRSAVTVRALAGGAPRGEAKITFVQQPRVASAVLRGLGVVLAVAVIAGSIIVGAVYGKGNQDAATPTAPPGSTTQPTIVTTSAAGAKPPAAPKIKLDPAQPVVAEPVTISAQVADGVTAFAWTTTKPDGTEGPNSSQPQFMPALEPAGAWKVKLTITGVDQTSSSSAELAFTVKDKPPNVEVVSQSIELTTEELTSTAISCPEGKFAVGGGAYVGQDDAEVLLFEQSMPIEGGKGWSVSVRDSGDDLEATGYATCADLPGLELVASSEDEATDTRRAGTATCPTGKVAVGGGGGFEPVDDPESRAFLDESAPTQDPGGTAYTSWTVLAESTSQRLLQTAVWCAPVPAGYEVQVNPLAAATGTGGVEPSVTCSTGQALSGGIAFAPGAGAVQVDPTRSIILRSSAPLTAQAGQTGQGWIGSATFTVALDQAIGAYVVCAELNG